MSTRKFSALALLVAFALPCAAGAAQFKIDPNHSSVGFSIRHFLSHVPGNFKKFEGKVNFDDKKPEASSADLTIEAASINTENDKRDTHLKSDDFFDAAKYPKITFKSSKVTKESDNKFKLEGELTMHGTTKPVTLEVEYLGTMFDPMSKINRAAFSLKGKLNRQEYGVKWNKALDKGGYVLGDDVDLNIEVEATQM